MTAPRPGLVWALAAAAVIAAVVSYGNARADNALADLRRDQLEQAFGEAAARRHARALEELTRDAERDSLASVLAASAALADSVDALSVELANASETNLAQLAAILADSASHVPDTVRILVGQTIDGLQEEVRTCQVGRTACETRGDALARDTVLLRRDLVARDSTIAESDSLLADYREQLGDALRTSIFDAKFVRLGERALAVYGLVRLVLELAGGNP